MSPSIITFPRLIFFSTSSILIIIVNSISPVQCRNPPAPAPAPAPIGLIQHTCHKYMPQTISKKLCFCVLESIPKVASAKDARSFVMTVIESGISNSTKTRLHIMKTLSNDVAPQMKVALKECIEMYNLVVSDFESALDAMKRNVYEVADYSLMTASLDNIPMCEKALANHNFKDEVIATGNKIVPMFAVAARTILEELPFPPW